MKDIEDTIKTILSEFDSNSSFEVSLHNDIVLEIYYDKLLDDVIISNQYMLDDYGHLRILSKEEYIEYLKDISHWEEEEINECFLDDEDNKTYTEHLDFYSDEFYTIPLDIQFEVAHELLEQLKYEMID